VGPVSSFLEVFGENTAYFFRNLSENRRNLLLPKMEKNVQIKDTLYRAANRLKLGSFFASFDSGKFVRNMQGSPKKWAEYGTSVRPLKHVT
jgi:hypothetical protein